MVVGESGFVVALDVVEHAGPQLAAAVVVGAVVDQPEGVRHVVHAVQVDDLALVGGHGVQQGVAREVALCGEGEGR